MYFKISCEFKFLIAEVNVRTCLSRTIISSGLTRTNSSLLIKSLAKQWPRYMSGINMAAEKAQKQKNVFLSFNIILSVFQSVLKNETILLFGSLKNIQSFAIAANF